MTRMRSVHDGESHDMISGRSRHVGESRRADIGEGCKTASFCCGWLRELWEKRRQNSKPRTSPANLVSQPGYSPADREAQAGPYSAARRIRHCSGGERNGASDSARPFRPTIPRQGLNLQAFSLGSGWNRRYRYSQGRQLRARHQRDRCRLPFGGKQWCRHVPHRLCLNSAAASRKQLFWAEPV